MRDIHDHERTTEEADRPNRATIATMKQLLILFLLSLGVHATAQDGAAPHEAPATSPPPPAPPPPPVDHVKRVNELLMPAGGSSTWLLCKADGSHWEGCDQTIERLVFNRSTGVLLRKPCHTEDSLCKEKFQVSKGTSEALLELPDSGVKYRVSRPNSCNAGCPGQSSCLRLSKVKEGLGPAVNIYLYREVPTPPDTTHSRTPQP